MRVAFSGTHRAGKTTLLDAASALLPKYEVIEEPYRLLEDEGYDFSDPPTAEDFERQLRRSIEVIEGARGDAFIDRCPLDFVAYLRALNEDFDLDDWLPRIRDAMEMLDLVVVVLIEIPDRIEVPADEDKKLRRAVDDEIRTLVLDDALGLGITTTEVHGDVDDRVHQVMRAMIGP